MAGTAPTVSPQMTNGTKSEPIGAGRNWSKTEQIQQKYAEERDKRLRSDGKAQYIDLTTTENQSLKSFVEDPWDDGSIPSLVLEEGAHFKIVIAGAGFGGLLFAVRLLNAGFKPEDIVIVDTAAGFGGTWYWNRYPGLMCDVESYIYMPLLEETGYMPKHKYSYGQELREHAHRIAKHWSFEDRTMFRTKLQRCSWSDDTAEWVVELAQQPTNGQAISAKVRADFVMIASGVLHRPKISDLPGLEIFHGPKFHTARWDYKATGGSQENPNLDRLQGKRVGIIGTGATAIQAIPQLAKWSKQLFVFQRTPSSVDVRGQRATDPDEWAREIKKGPGWQATRSRNFISFTTNTKPAPAIDMVSDGWTGFAAYRALTGSSNAINADHVAEHVAELHELDLPRSERIRARAEEVVKDKHTAEKLKAWYPGWCKRPTFHDDYLPTFNLPHVTLIDTDGKGVQHITQSGVMVNGENIELDVLVFSTGFELDGRASPGARARVQTFGRGGRSMDEKWSQRVATVHGIATNDFPNMFFLSPNQAGAGPNYMQSLDTMAHHAAFMMSKGLKKAGHNAKFTIEPTREAEEAWSMRVQAGAATFAAVSGCTPSYFNAEGMTIPAEERMKAARSGPWPLGLNNFMDTLQDWRDAGDFSDFKIATAE